MFTPPPPRTPKANLSPQLNLDTFGGSPRNNYNSTVSMSLFRGVVIYVRLLRPYFVHLRGVSIVVYYLVPVCNNMYHILYNN